MPPRNPGRFSVLDEWGVLPPRRSFFGSRWYFRNFATEVAEDMADLQVDIVHVQNFSQFVPIIRKANPQAQIVLHMHADWLIELDRAWVRPRLEQVDAVVCCSDYFARGIRREWPEFADRVRVVYNGISPAEMASAGAQGASAASGRRVLFVGRVTPDKGLHVLVDAFNRIVEEIPDADLVLVGPWVRFRKGSLAVHTSKEPAVRDLARFAGSPYVDHLRARQSPNAAARTTIAGEVSREELLRHYRQADLLVLPSVYQEGFGIPIVEAAAFGLPTVATRRGGIPEVVVDGETGLLVEAGNPDALRSAIVALLMDDTKRRGMGSAARQRTLDRFTWDRVAASLGSVYDSMAH